MWVPDPHDRLESMTPPDQRDPGTDVMEPEAGMSVDDDERHEQDWREIENDVGLGHYPSSVARS